MFKSLIETYRKNRFEKKILKIEISASETMLLVTTIHTLPALKQHSVDTRTEIVVKNFSAPMDDTSWKDFQIQVRQTLKDLQVQETDTPVPGLRSFECHQEGYLQEHGLLFGMSERLLSLVKFFLSILKDEFSW